MAVTLRDGTRFRILREPLGCIMQAQWNLVGPVQPGKNVRYEISAYIDFEEVGRRGQCLEVFRWYRRLVLDHLRAFHPDPRTKLKKRGRWAQP